MSKNSPFRGTARQDGRLGGFVGIDHKERKRKKDPLVQEPQHLASVFLKLGVN